MSRKKSGLKMKVCYVYEIGNVDGTSFTKIKTVYDSSSGLEFDRQKHSAVFNALVKKISKKYAVHTVIV